MGQKNIYYCIGCGKEHERGEFYISYNSNHKNGVYPFCKKYIKKEVYKKDGSINIKKFKNLLMQIDAPFLINEFEGALKDKRETIGTYFSRISMVQNRELRWKNSVFGDKENKPQDKKLDRKIINKSTNIAYDLSEAKQRWGENYDEQQLEQLERFYIDMRDANNIETPQDRFYLEKLSLISLKMDEELEAGNYAQAKQLGDLFSKYMADSEFRATDKTDADRQGGIRNFGIIYKEVEKDGHIPPWEYYRKIKGLNQDILDKTIMHIENFTLRFNKAEIMTSPPSDTPKASPDEIDENSIKGGGYNG